MGTVFPFQALADKESNDMASLQSTCSQSSHTLPTNNMMIIKNIADMEKKRLDSHWTCSSRTSVLRDLFLKNNYAQDFPPNLTCLDH